MIYNDNFNNKTDNEEVAIIGIGFRLPSGYNEEGILDEPIKSSVKLWEKLMNGFDGIVKTDERWSSNYNKLQEISSGYSGLLPLREWKSFDPLLFGINPNGVSAMDPQQRLLLTCTFEALEDAQIDPLSIRGTNTCVHIGSSAIDYQQVNKDGIKNNIFASAANSIANRISYCFDLHGESITLDTACSSSLNALSMGYNAIKSGKSKVSISGGVQFLNYPSISKSFTILNMMSKNGRCRPFDRDADGYTRSEGVGVVVMKLLSEAIKDGDNIYCVINGISSNVDGNGISDKSNFYQPSSISQANNIKLALKSTNGKIKESDIQYVEAHGTGTPAGDPIECKGISMALNNNNNNNNINGSKNSNNPILIGSIKSNIGHLEGCSGVASLIKCCLILKNKYFLPNINFQNPNPDIKFDEWNLRVVTKPIPFNENKTTSILLNNFGITGSNVSLVLSEFKRNGENNDEDDDDDDDNNNNGNKTDKKLYLIPFSSNSKKSLENYQDEILKRIDSIKSNIKFKDFIKYQIQSKSTLLCQRSIVLSSDDWNEFNENLSTKNQQQLIQTTNMKSSNLSNIKKNPQTIFIFCGQGSQWNNQALQLYNNEITFRKTMDMLDDKFYKYYGYSILKKLRSIPDTDLISIHDPILAQPATCMLQVALFELYKSWGISPSIIIGHSLGEISSSYCAGMFDLDTFCYIVYHRAIAQSKTNGSGKMLSTLIDEDDFKLNYSLKYPLVEVACYNSPSSVVLAGKEEELIEISNHLKSRNIHSAFLGSLSSFHTNSQIITKDDILSLKFKSNQPKIPCFSTVTSELFNNDKTKFTPEYILENILNPVKFSQTILNLYKYIQDNDLGSDIAFIELAPHSTLAFYLKQMMPSTCDQINSNYFTTDQISIHSPLSKKKPNDYYEFLQTISKLYCDCNYKINFNYQFNHHHHHHHHQKNNNNQKPLNNFKNHLLPNYQFDQQEYWSGHSKFLIGPSINILGNKNKKSSFDKSYTSIIDIKKPPFQYLKGHQVKDKYYFPGTGYISNILNIFPNQNLSINYIEFKAPLVQREGVSNYLQTNIYSTSKNEYRAQFNFKNLKNNKNDDDDGQWINCSNANIQIMVNDDELIHKKEDINQLISTKCNLTKLSKSEVYGHIKLKTGLNYSDSFQGVSELFLGDQYSLATISLNVSNGIDSNLSSSFFNAALLDTCLHGFILLINDSCSLVFDKIEYFNYYSSNVPLAENKSLVVDKIYVYSRYINRCGNSYYGRIKVFLSDGTLLIDMVNACCTSLSTIKDSLTLEYPKDIIFSRYLQSKDTPLNLPSSFQHLYDSNQFKINDIINLNYQNYSKFISNLLYQFINERKSEINLKTIQTLEINQLINNYYCSGGGGVNDISKHQRLFKYAFETIKNFGITNEETFSMNKDFQYPEILIKTTRIISKLLFPKSNEDPNVDTPKSLYQDGSIDKFYTNSDLIMGQINLASEIIKQSIQPLIKERMVFRIIEFGGGNCSLTLNVLEKIYQLSSLNDFNIDIEFTWSDINQTIIENAKEKIKKFININHPSNEKRIQFIFKTLNLNNQLIKEEELKPSYYDMVIMSNVMNVVDNIQFSLNEIYKILSPNGYLLFIELPYKSIIFDCLFGVFEQWWKFDDNDTIRIDRSCINQISWEKVLNDSNFKNTIMSNDFNSSTTFLIHTQKPSLNQLKEKEEERQQQQQQQVDKVIIFKNQYQSNYSLDLYPHDMEIIKEVSSIKEFNEIHITDNSMIYFIKGIEELTIENFKQVSLEYIQINQRLLKLKSKCKHVLITLESTTSNYLASSLNGSFTYFLEFPQLELFSIDFDRLYSSGVGGINTNNGIIDYQLIKPLLNSNINNQREFMIRDKKVYFERYKKEELSTLQKDFKSTSYCNLNSSSSSSGGGDDEVYLHLNLNLEYELRSKMKTIQKNQVEVEIKATGINYKDYLVYCGLLPPEMMNHTGDVNNPEIGCEFSGIITRVGGGGGGGEETSKEFKVGDSVFGIGYNTTSSHIIIDKDFIHRKPLNISHCQASSIPIVYSTSYHGIYNIGNLKNDESILIHSGTGGVGLSALNILKWKDHKGLIFVTVGSKEKEQYLLDTYGLFINGGIFSTRDTSYVSKIKEIISKENQKNGIDNDDGNDGGGVDLILNTLNSSEFMDSNFKSLEMGGRIVDLSITHLNQNEFTLNNKFKYNYSYHNVELVFVRKQIIKKLLITISNAIESNQLNLMPIKEFSNENVKDAIEYINKRIHIGKIVVNNNVDILSLKQQQQQQQNNNNNNNLPILKSNYEIKSSNIGKTLLITGQSGVVLELLKWILKYSKSLENVIVLSRSSLKWELEFLMNKFNNIKFHFKRVDVSDYQSVDESMDQVFSKDSSITNVDTILHFAYQHATCGEQDIDMENLNLSHGAKTFGAINLHNQSIKRNWKLINFILASSVTAVIGSYNQCSYVGANKVLDALSSYRHSIGLPCIASNWGAFGEAGVVARNDEIWSFVEGQGLNGIPTPNVLASLDLQIQNQHLANNLIISKFNFKTFKDLNQIHHQKFDFILNQVQDDSRLKSSQFDIGDSFLDKVSQSLSIDKQKIDIDLQLGTFGLDSLMLVQLKNWIDKEVTPNILNTQQLSNNKISTTINIIKSEFEKIIKEKRS
ncbi:hypothetical protein ACTA71_005419 [Dictyostelium dimigraforme]